MFVYIQILDTQKFVFAGYFIHCYIVSLFANFLGVHKNIETLI